MEAPKDYIRAKHYGKITDALTVTITCFLNTTHITSQSNETRKSRATPFYSDQKAPSPLPRYTQREKKTTKLKLGVAMGTRPRQKKGPEGGRRNGHERRD